MKTKNKLLVAVIFSMLSLSMAADDVVAFSDDFERASVSPGGTPSMAYTVTNTGDATGAVTEMNSENYSLKLTCGGTVTTAGKVFVIGNFASFSESYKAKLGDNTVDSIVWAFNIRQNYQGNLSGFTASGTRDLGVVLCADGADITSANGYAIINSSSKYTLVKFTGGLKESSNPTALVEGQSVSSNNRACMSIKVVYIPETDTWKLYDRIDGTSGIADLVDPATEPAGKEYVFAGSAVDDTYTSTIMTNFGFTSRYPTTSTSAFNIWIDNFKVTLAGYEDPGGGTGICNPADKPVFDIKEVQNGFILYAENAKVAVYDVAGRLIRQSFVAGFEEFSFENKGLYMVNIHSEGKEQKLKFFHK